MNDKQFYDKEKVLETYLAHRKRPDNPNDAIEKPIIWELLGDVRGLDVIDLGCGGGLFGRELLSNGAASYHGIEISDGMVEIAEMILADSAGTVTQQSIESWEPVPDSADLITSRLAFNYIEPIETVFAQIYKALRPNGRLIISVEHPIISSNYCNLDRGQRTDWIVDDYFRSGARPHRWLGQEIVKYHHTLDDWLRLVQRAPLRLDAIRESRPERDNFQSADQYERRMRIPLFLFLSARKS